MISAYAVTLDVDWAPDCVIDFVAERLVQSGVKATWFITHDSPATRRLMSCPSFEVGLHPNFGPGSTQGGTPREVMTFLRGIAPSAQAVRTHSLIQSSPLLKLMCEDFQVRTDVSLLLPDTPFLTPHRLYFSPTASLVRLPYIWEDDDEMCLPHPVFRLDGKWGSFEGLRILDFHPIHVVLNSRSMQPYENYKRAGRRQDCALSDVTGFANTTMDGTRTFLEDLLRFEETNSGSCRTVSDIAFEWAQSHERRGHRQV